MISAFPSCPRLWGFSDHSSSSGCSEGGIRGGGLSKELGILLGASSSQQLLQDEASHLSPHSEKTGKFLHRVALSLYFSHRKLLFLPWASLKYNRKIREDLLKYPVFVFSFGVSRYLVWRDTGFILELLSPSALVIPDPTLDLGP